MRAQKIIKKNYLLKTLVELKKDYIRNQEVIKVTESTLNSISDTEIRSELESYRHFDILNTEKMTPRFLTLVKAQKANCSLDVILDDTGTAFPSETARDRFICDF
jgi:hypothetical protein